MVSAVGKRYGRVTALANVGLRLRRGTVTGLVGPNGSGKSTLLGVCAGLVRADTGTALVAGARVGTIEAARAVAFVPDEPRGFDEITVRELAALLARLHRAHDAERRFRSLADAFALRPLLDRRLGELSRGQRRRAALVAALQLEAPVILVDEATATLDVTGVGVLRAALEGAAADGAVVVVATHDAAFVDAVADGVVALRDGRIVERRPHVRGLPEGCDAQSAA